MSNKSYSRVVKEFIEEGGTNVTVKVADPYNQESLAEGHWKGNLRILVESIVGSESKEAYLVRFKTDNAEGYTAMAADKIVDWIWENIENVQVVRVDLIKIPEGENKVESFVMTRE